MPADIRSMTRLSASALLLALVGMGVTGCETSRADAVHNDPAMGLQTLAQTPSDVDNRLTIVANEDFRMFWEDLGRAMYLDRPSKLTPETVPYRP